VHWFFEHAQKQGILGAIVILVVIYGIIVVILVAMVSTECGQLTQRGRGRMLCVVVIFISIATVRDCFHSEPSLQPRARYSPFRESYGYKARVWMLQDQTNMKKKHVENNSTN